MFGVSDAQLSQRSQIRRVLLTAAMQRVELCQRFWGEGAISGNSSKASAEPTPRWVQVRSSTQPDPSDLAAMTCGSRAPRPSLLFGPATGLERTGCMTTWRGPHGPVWPRRYALRTLSRGTSTVLPSILTNMFAGFSGLRFTRATPGLSPSSATMTFS
jgi:hypothetical protein